MTPVEILKDKFNEISSRRNSGELEMWEAYELRENSFTEALQMEKEMFKSFYIGGLMNGMASNKMDIELDIEDTFNELYQKYTA
jgi:hypothetical protein